jgi:capsid portal protein
MSKKNKENNQEIIEFDGGIEQKTVKQAMVKALVITGRYSDEDSAMKAMSSHEEEWGELGAVDPILPPDSLLSLYEISDSLRQNIESYAHNIEGNGHVLTPKFDLSPKNKKAFDEVKDSMDAAAWSDAVTAEMARLDRQEEETGETVSQADRHRAIDELVVKEPADDAVNAEMERLKLAMKREKHMADSWFKNVHPTMSFLELRERKRIDEEAVGRAAWEVRRDNRGMIRRLEQILGHTVLPLKGDGDEVEVEREEWVSAIETRPSIETVKFRRYVQRANGKVTYFKDLGDPRLVSDKTGKVYMKNGTRNGKKILEPDYKTMKKDEPDAGPAQELIFFSTYSPKTTAGMVRWAAMSPHILGSRAASESNLAYFENHAVPDAILLVSGGQLNNESVERIKENLRAKTRGAKNHHRVLVVQATANAKRPNEVPNNPDMEWKNLADFQQGDALFQDYTENNKKALSSAFRQALLLIGQIPSDLNRATALAIMSLVDKQVYGPLRRRFDWFMNNTLLPAIGIKLLKFESLSPEAQNIEEMAKAIEYGVKGGAFTPNILLELYGLWFNREFPKIEEPWGDVPFAATLNQLDLGVERPEDVDSGGVDGDGGDDKGSKKALQNRVDELEKSFADLFERFRSERELASGF